MFRTWTSNLTKVFTLANINTFTSSCIQMEILVEYLFLGSSDCPWGEAWLSMYDLLFKQNQFSSNEFLRPYTKQSKEYVLRGWRATLNPFLNASVLWAERDPLHVTLAVTQSLGFWGLIRRIVPIQLPFTTNKGFWWLILTQIPTRHL